MNWGTNRMKSSKVPRICDFRLRWMTVRDKGAKRLSEEEERSLGRKPTGKLCH